MKIKSIIGIVLLIIILCVCIYNHLFHANQHSKTIHSYKEIIETAERWDTSTLVLFDIDDTLIYGPCLFPKGLLQQWLFRYPWFAQTDQWEEYYSLMWQQADRVLLEQQVVNIIQRLQQRNVTVLGITSMETGAYGVIENMPIWRADMLKNLGVSFSDIYPDVTFSRFTAYRTHYPELFKGILCCNQQSKMQVLDALLAYYQLKPNKIVYFDDDVQALGEIAALCKKREILFEGYNYLGSEQYHCNWDMQKALQQLDFMVQHHAWPTK